jgi:hypothetical protein
MGEERTHTRSDFRIERARICAGDFNTREFMGIASFQVLAPQSRKLHTVLSSAAIVISYSGVLITTLAARLHCRDILLSPPIRQPM